MARDSDLYFVDVYVPNEGEPESALELAIVRVGLENEKPQVYVHTYLKPVNYNLSRIRWSDSYEYHINRALIEQHNWPTLLDIAQANYLKDKNVVCFCSTLEPIQSLVSDSHYTYSILSIWQDIFAQNDDAFDINHYKSMLEYMGLPQEDSSNTKYTLLMKRLFAQVAIWFYLYHCRTLKCVPDFGDSSLAITPYWPLKNVPDPWYDSNLKELAEIPREALRDYFSERLSDYIDWSHMLVYRHDWAFRRERRYEVKLTELDSMMQFIFTRVFNLRTRILVLTYYALYNNKIDYANTIALHQGTYITLPQAVRDDFGYFMITHLDDFLSAEEKRTIISALTTQVIRAKDATQKEKYDFYELRKYSHENNLEFIECHIPSNKAIKYYKEIKNKNEVLCRYITIEGNEQERAECIEHINQKFAELLNDARNPFSDYWTSPGLKIWIEYITGFKWNELVRESRPNDNESLIKTRQTICDIINELSRPYYQAYVRKFRKIVNEINNIDDNEKATMSFEFLGTTYDIVVDFTDKRMGFLTRFFNRF